MTIRALRPTVVLAALLLTTAALHAQLPKDNDVWKTRCTMLSSTAAQIQSGNIPPVLVSATRGVSGPAFAALAFDRSNNGDHNVACSLFYMAAIAQRLGNGGKPDPDSAQDAATLAGAEIKESHGQSLSFSELYKRKKGQFSAKNLTSAETTAVLQAATTIPLSTSVSTAQPTPVKSTRSNSKS